MKQPRIALPTCGRVLGVDWSGAASSAKKIWAAAISFDGGTGARLESLGRPFAGCSTPAEVAEEFAGWLESQSFDAAGLDFCFGVARNHDVPGMPRTGPADLGQWLRANCRTPEEFCDALGCELKRATDRHRRSPFAPTNLRMYRQTYWA